MRGEGGGGRCWGWGDGVGRVGSGFGRGGEGGFMLDEWPVWDLEAGVIVRKEI